MTTYFPPPKRILIVRLSAIGDTIHSLPLAAALKRAWPDCRLEWVVEQPSAGLIVANPLIDRAHVLPKGWLKSPSRVRALRRELRREPYDFAFDPQGLTKSATAAWLSGTARRIGFTRGEGRELAPLLDTILVEPKGVHAVDRTLSLLAGADLASPERGEFVLPPCEEGDAEAMGGLLASPVYAGGFILLGPWGSFPAKLWPLDRFLELAAALRSASGLPSLMLGHGDRERGAIRTLAERSGGVLAPAPDLSLTGVAELARRATLFVGCDSFPMHAAAAVGCPTLGLFSVTDPARLGPYGPHGRAVFESILLPKSTRERRRLPADAMLGLGVEKVTRAALDLLGTA